MIPYGRHFIDDADIAAVVSALRSDSITQGDCAPLFENGICELVGATFSVAVNSATSALHLACLALEVGSGDLVWTSATTFVASANCALYCGARIDFVDIDLETGNISVEALNEKLNIAAVTNRLPKVLIAVHLTGEPCDMVEIWRLANAFGVKVIEDASHAIGATYREKKIGACQYSNITVFSFHPVKIITTAEGGVATTNDPKLARTMQLLRSHGITKDPTEMSKEPDGPWYYEQIGLGFNYRMSDIHAALGLSQLAKIDEFIAARHKIAECYDIKLNRDLVQLPLRHSKSCSALHLYVIRVSEKYHLEVFKKLRSDGIGVNLHYIPVHLHPFFRKMGFSEGSYPNSESYYRQCISLPIYPLLSNDDQNYVIDKLHNAIQEITR